MIMTTGFSRKITVVLGISLLLSCAMLVMAVPGGEEGSANAEPTNRAGQGSLSKISNPRATSLRGVTWKPGTDEAFMVGEGSIYMYKDSTGKLTQLDGPESTDHYYEDIAWQPKGEYAILVGATPATTRAKGLISKMWKEGPSWRISALTTSEKTRFTGIEWAPDSTYAIIVGGARSGEDTNVASVMLRFSGISHILTPLYSDTGGSGLSDVGYNTAEEKFYAVGLNGKMVTYDGDIYEVINDNKLKNSNMFSITWRDNGGRGIMGGWFGSTLKGHLLTTDGNYNAIIQETPKYINDADWAPRSDFTLLVGQKGAIWEYSGNDGLVLVDNLIDTKHYYCVDFNSDGTSAIIVGQDGTILQYNVSYPPQENYPPNVNIESPADGTIFDYGVGIIFNSNGSHDDDLDVLDYEWISNIDGRISTDPIFNISTLTTGQHTITLELDDANGHVSKMTINISIKAPENPPRVDAGEDLIGYAGEDITLNAHVVDSDFEIESYEWDYEGTNEYRGTLEPSTDYRYNNKGVYTATLRVTDIRKASGTDNLIVTIFPKRSLADDLVSIEPSREFQPKDNVLVRLNMSNAKKIEVQFLDPKAKIIHVPPTKEAGTFQVILPKNVKSGNYDVRWRYYDHTDNMSAWYESNDAFKVKIPHKNNNGFSSALPYIGAGVGILVTVFIVIFVFMFMYRRSLTTIDIVILMYRDGRVMHTYSPPRIGSNTKPVPPETVTQVQGVVMGQINNIRQGVQDRLPTQLNLGHQTVFIEQGMNTLLSVAHTGPEPTNLRKKMKNTLQELEVLYGNQLRQWDGMVATMPAIQKTVAKYMKIQD